MLDKNTTVLDSVFYWPSSIDRIKYQQDNFAKSYSSRLSLDWTISICLARGQKHILVEPGVILAVRLHLCHQTCDHIHLILREPFAFSLHLRKLRPRAVVGCSRTHGQLVVELDFYPVHRRSASLLLSSPCPSRVSPNCPGEWWWCLPRSTRKAESTSWSLMDSYAYHGYCFSLSEARRRRGEKRLLSNLLILMSAALPPPWLAQPRHTDRCFARGEQQLCVAGVRGSLSTHYLWLMVQSQHWKLSSHILLWKADLQQAELFSATQCLDIGGTCSDVSVLRVPASCSELGTREIEMNTLHKTPWPQGGCHIISRLIQSASQALKKGGRTGQEVRDFGALGQTTDRKMSAFLHGGEAEKEFVGV